MQASRVTRRAFFRARARPGALALAAVVAAAGCGRWATSAGNGGRVEVSRGADTGALARFPGVLEAGAGVPAVVLLEAAVQGGDAR